MRLRWNVEGIGVCGWRGCEGRRDDDALMVQSNKGYVFSDTRNGTEPSC